MEMFDINNNKAVVNGKVYHDNFKNFQLDFDISAHKFMCLNTSETDNGIPPKNETKKLSLKPHI